MHVEIYKEEGGTDWRWRLMAPNGKNVANSGEGYRRRGACVTAWKKIAAALRAFDDVRIVEIVK